MVGASLAVQPSIEYDADVGDVGMFRLQLGVRCHRKEAMTDSELHLDSERLGETRFPTQRETRRVAVKCNKRRN